MRLQTYYALLSTLLALLLSAVCLAVCMFAFDTPAWAMILILPASIIVFLISLLIGSFLAEPLTDLVKKTAAWRRGTPVPIEPDGRMRETDLLACDFKTLVQTTNQQRHDLTIKERRQNDFISDVAHELRTPLTAIRGNAEMLTDPDLPPELHDKFCNIIVNESERLSRLTHDLLTLQKLDNSAIPTEMKRIDLRELTSSVVDALMPILIERQANVQVVGEAPDVLGNPDSLRQAITNLVENASRFIEPGGHITVKLYGLNGNSIVTVSDDGTGFGDVDPKMLFDRFYRTDASRARNTGGSGLGLAIVKSVVESHDGTVEAFNNPEGGASFLIAIPSIAASEGTK